LNVLRELLRIDTDSRYLLFLDRPEPELEQIGQHVQQIIVPVRHRLLSRAWAQIMWPICFRRRGVDLVHHIKNLSTWGLPGRSVVTLYDMTILLHPEIYLPSDRIYWRWIQPQMLRRADRLIAISQETRRDLVRFYGLDANDIVVIYPAYDPRFRPVGPEAVRDARRRHGIKERFLLHVGSLSLKKNLLTLLMAFERLRERGYPGQLVLVGRPYGKGRDEQFFSHLEVSPYRDDVLLTGPLPDEELPPLCNGAELMIYPSLHEGFGIVALEAMACGTPVIASRAGALPEVVGEGGILVEQATDPAALADAAEPLLRDEALRQAWSRRGLEWVRRYTTTEAARRTLAVYDQVLEEASRTTG
jgi:glycosyltransferase involved in cell wall biosynthesis